jgi:LmbE family N-acetylglucosaminyl deacetylase
MSLSPLRLLIFGAHPDDPDFCAGGLAALFSGLGHVVKMISLTNGDAGHHEMSGESLATRRRAEAAEAGKQLGAEYITLDFHDGYLAPSFENRDAVIRIIREFRPDLITIHRPNDYHPDHRNGSILVQDASFLVTVPSVVPEVEALRRMPVIMYSWDHFSKPAPFEPDVVVGIDEVMEAKFKALHCHTSQMYEWLPYLDELLDEVPKDAPERLAWLREWRSGTYRAIANEYRDQLIADYGEVEGSRVEFAEAFEVCEYGLPLSDDLRRRLFPFLFKE